MNICTKLIFGATFVLASCGNYQTVLPVEQFNSGGHHEQQHEIPCPYPNMGDWHRCHRTNDCCPDGFACGEDKFTPLQDKGLCEWQGL